MLKKLFFSSSSDELTIQLGWPKTVLYGPEASTLEIIENPNSDLVYLVRFRTSEFTILCPLTGQPDFAKFVIDYIPRSFLLESKSMKLFLTSFRNYGSFHENTTLYIAQRVVSTIRPLWLRIRGHWYPRGGLPIDIFWQTGEPPASLWLPDI